MSDSFIAITFCLAILTQGALATLPSSSIHNVKHLTTNYTPCAPDTCGIECMQGSKTGSNSTVPTATLFGSSAPDAINSASESINSSRPAELTNGLQKHATRPGKRVLPSLPAITELPAYVAGLSRYISLNNQWILRDPTNNRFSTTNAWLFPKYGGSAVGINRLTGCSSVIIISSRGVFVSHLAEVPTFISRRGSRPDMNNFYRRTILTLREGNPSLGLDFLTQPGQILAPEHDPQVFVFTPFCTEQDRGRGIDTTFRYEREIDNLTESLRNYFPHARTDPEILGYTRRTVRDARSNFVTGVSPFAGFGGRVIVEFDADERDIETPQVTYRLGKWRLWLEDTVMKESYYCHGSVAHTVEDSRSEVGSAFGRP
ncbi:hypothetical protein EV356DRAFT_576760 [Viridothelium virens]|uniref:Uncharacterized protein n=1 Tax=Viridothelium virens TaxID=1048519 RepID=A0A6A6H8P5_VIRVR|nr:hypothetical protein EV356DRAFT_576760 [Viridothelium virens]